MKKLALLVGSLAIAATAFAGGKEYQPPVKEVLVKEVIREVPVYRSARNGGYLEMYYRWWGESSEHSHSDWYWTSNDKKVKDKLKNGNRGRLHIQGLVNLTERQSIFFRVRDNQAISDNGITTYETALGTKRYSGESTQVRVRYNFKHDFANLNATSRLHYQNDGEYTGAAVGKNNLEYQFRMQFAEYMFDNSFIKTTDFTFAPKVGYSWDNSSKNRVDDDGKVGHASTPYFGADLYTAHKLPWNFTFEFNVYLNSVHSNYKYYEGKKSNFQATAEAYLKNTTPLWTGDKAKLSFYFEGGFDPYKYSQRRIFDHADDLSNYANLDGEKTSYSLYALPALRVDYQATENVNLFLVAGAEMRNIHETGCEAQGFEWQPTAWAGFKVNF